MSELIAFATTRYRCPDCRKSFAAKGTAERHLSHCFKSPANRTCLTCKHRAQGPGGEPECAIGEAMWPCCAGCGTGLADEGYAHHAPDCASSLVANYLSVRCETWEARP